MPIISYLATPNDGEKARLLSCLQSMDYCEAFGAENKDLIILVTDTPNEPTEKKLQQQLKALPALQNLSMAYGHSEHSNPHNSQEQ